MTADTYRTKVLGSLLGGAIGDALGAPVEFWSRDQITSTVGHGGVRDYLETTFGEERGLGLITDDTQMTLFTMEGLIAAYERSQARGIGFTMQLVHESYLRWYQTQVTTEPVITDHSWLAGEQWLYSRRAPGDTCLSALRIVKEDPAPRPALLAERAPNNSKGCGSVMRAAPFGWIPCNERDLDQWIIPSALQVAGFTHGHPTAQIAAAALAVIVRELIFGAEIEDAVITAQHKIEWIPESHETTDALQQALHLAEDDHGNIDSLNSLGEGWIAEQALAIAVYCAASFPREDHLLEALSLSVSHSGDSDSTGAICGNILGARHGIHALPTQLIEDLEGLPTLTRMGEQFVDTFTGMYRSTSRT